MIRDLVLYFLRQGSYSREGDIAVLCAYLGQLQKVRAALRDLKIAVAVDDRDAEQLVRQGIDEDVEFEEVVVAKHVRFLPLPSYFAAHFLLGTSRHSRHIPGTRSKNRHRLPRS